MDLTLSDEHRMLAEAVRSFVTRDCPAARVREIEASDTGFDVQHWKTLAELGLLGLLVPEEHGGSGRGCFEMAVVCAELGRGPLPSAIIVSSVLATTILLQGTQPAIRDHWMPKLADGTAIVSVALVGPGDRDEWDSSGVEAVDAGGQITLTGTKILVPFANSADVLLVSACSDGAQIVVAVDPASGGVSLRRQDDGGGEPVFEIVFDGVAVGQGDVIAGPDTAGAVLDSALQSASVAALAYAIGGGERSLELSVEHAQTREQFGRPIGSFQAVAHRCVDMLTDIEACRYLCYQAAWAIDGDRTSGLEVAAAGAYGSEALRRVLMNAHQVHGAIGYSMEHELQFHSRRSKVFELSYGGPARHREHVAVVMGLGRR
jgi:alkylation response protein AidB-like acyl-CoA dehydrogenase